MEEKMLALPRSIIWTIHHFQFNHKVLCMGKKHPIHVCQVQIKVLHTILYLMFMLHLESHMIYISTFYVVGVNGLKALEPYLCM
jgi:hypothetical protein